jgi:iron complex outermembrane receptor protein
VVARAAREPARAVAYTYLDARYVDPLPDLHRNAMCGRERADRGRQPHPRCRTRLRSMQRWPGRRRKAGAAGSRRALSRVFVNDLNSDAASGFATASANLGYVAHVGPWDLSGFGRIDNLFGRKYAGSVIVNEGNSRFFEPAPGRTWTAGVSGTVSF